ncbi:response regulator [Pleurocapsales cyanobacterium LEGE 06147]|nr:response regulator [Pleurocapsales cyanobacterium LEGE 06147]
MDLKLSSDLSTESFLEQPLVLAVDDNEDNLLLISYVLKSFQYRYITTTSSQQTLSIARNYLPDLILLDIVLPEIDGLEIARILKQDKSTNHIPIIAVTGLALADQREEIAKAGCDDYLCKPFLLEQLEAKITFHLNQFSGGIQKWRSRLCG